jgi:hypothetical protein
LLERCLAFIGIVRGFEEFFRGDACLLVFQGYESVIVSVGPEILFRTLFVDFEVISDVKKV